MPSTDLTPFRWASKSSLEIAVLLAQATPLLGLSFAVLCGGVRASVEDVLPVLRSMSPGQLG